MSRFLKMGQACKVLNVCRKTMRRYCVEGIVEAEQIPAGNRMDWRISEDSCHALLQGSELKARVLEHVRGLR